MKKLYTEKINNIKPILQLVLVVVLALAPSVFTQAQVKVDFTPRSSAFTPDKTVYNVKGDFTMLGNTNLTLVDYDDNGNNSEDMVYVDVDNDSATWNSSAASLNLSDQISPECTNIVYAGLYWTGRSTGDNEFTVTKEFDTGKTITENISDDVEVFNGQAIPNTTYGLAITNSTTLATYTFTSTAGGNTVTFFLYKGYNDDKTYLKVSVNNGPQTDVATSSLTNANVILKTPYTIFSGSDYALKIKRLEVIPQNRAHVNISYTSTYNETVERTKSFNKRKVSIKGPSASSYTQLTAHASDIYYPSGTDNDIFSAYVDVTDYVKNNGNNGLYHVADIALVEGDGDGIGFYGGWGMVVVYENSEMSWKDVTVFDGHAFVDSSITISHFLDVSGFNTTQQGPVKVKLGVMAGEGDRTIAGDYFKIRRTSDNAFESLAHSGNSLTNFFNSSIQTPGVRIPYLLNNTGMDISMFDLDNEDKAIINNNQTSTRFEYGSTQDTYAIFNITVAVDSYIPESEGLLSLVDIAGKPATAPYVALPGDELQYHLEIRNKGSEPIQNAKLVIPIPFTSQFVPGSINFNEYDSLFNATAPYYDPNEGATGAIVWDIAYLPLDTDVTKLLANLRFKLKTTEDCSILVNDGCAPKIVILGGYISGTGANSGIVYSLPLIQGYDQNGICEGIPNTDPIVVDIDAVQYILDNCANVSLTRTFLYCNLENNSIPVSEVAAQFPPGSLFYNSFPVTDASIQYTASNPFPATMGQSTYYAIPPGVSSCTYTFTIEVNDITSSPTVANVEYCLNQTANPLSAQASNPDYTVFYYADIDPNTVGQSSLVPDTSVKGTVTYYASEGPAENCVNPNRTPFTVTVNDGLTINLVEQVNDSCSNLNSGSLSISATGGSGNFTYAWDFNGTPIATTQNVNNLAEGTYSVTVSDADSDCTTTKSFVIITENTSPLEINAPAALVVNGCTVDDITINNNTSLAYSASISTIGIAKFLSEGGTFIGDGITTVTYSDTASGACPLIVTRTFSITDTCNQTASTTQTISIENTTPPTLAVPSAKTVECGASIEPSATGTATVTDACGTVEITYVDASVENCGETETITRTWTATDACGNASTGTQIITIVDTTAPVLTLPSDTTVECSESIAPFATGLATATDTCSEVAITYVDAAVAACGTTEIITRTWTATDACGNAVSGDQIINVVDTVAPVITAPEDVTLECSGLSRMSGSGFGEATATDGCGEVVITFEDSAIAGCGNTQSITRTWTATDECGNTASTSQTITVVDTTAPIITAPKDIVVECSESIDPSVTGTPDAFDACGGVKVTYADVDAYDTCGNTKIIERTWTATDDCGLTSTATQFLTIVDTTAPVIETPAENVVLNCNADGNTGSLTAWLTTNGGAAASDSCSTDLTWTNNYDGGVSDCNEPVTVVFTVTDACGNASTTTATYTVQDSVAPALTPASNFTAECISESTMGDFQDWLETNGGATAADACSAVIWSNDFTALAEECNSTGTITFTATDGCGNSSSTTATYTISDTTAPIIATLPSETTVDCSMTPEFAQAVATDECGSEVTLTFEDITTAGDCEVAYAITRTWTATDVCGNASTASQTINVQDITAPVIAALPAESTVECDAEPNFAQAIATDACGPDVTLTFEDVQTESDSAGTYAITRTWTATDACGNASTASQTINVQNSTDLAIAPLPAESTVDCGVAPIFAQATATGACGSDVTLTFEDIRTDGDCEGAYTITRTWTATDAYGNVSEAFQTINVQDTTAPSLVTQYEAEITLACDNIPTAPNLVFEDSCSNTINVAFNETSTAAEGVENYVITRTWTVSDTCDNEAVYTQIINVNAAPVITVTDTELCNGDDLNFDLFDLLSGTFDTNGTWSVVTGNAPLDGSIFNPYQLELGTYTFKYTLADDYCTSEAFVNIRLHDDCVVLPCGTEDVIISKAVTTYTDGKNDFFTVTGVETCGFTVELQIFNRWGAMIYESKNYQNDWNGTSSKASVGNSNYVPTGTYYYVINLRNSGLKPFAGPIYVATK